MLGRKLALVRKVHGYPEEAKEGVARFGANAARTSVGLVILMMRRGGGRQAQAQAGRGQQG